MPEPSPARTPSPAKPVPVADPHTEGYWRSLAGAGVLAIQWCGHCQRFQHFPEPICSRCGQADDLTYRPVSGRGNVYTFVVSHRSAVTGFTSDGLPHVIAWVELPEQAGLRVLTNIVGTPVDNVYIGMPVQLVLERRGDAVLPQFCPRHAEDPPS